MCRTKDRPPIGRREGKRRMLYNDWLAGGVVVEDGTTMVLKYQAHFFHLSLPLFFGQRALEASRRDPAPPPLPLTLGRRAQDRNCSRSTSELETEGR
ncbi:hypothetical protein CDAR_68901 [Caerostris darwini]|uniref:Uncharacterized protein n=1 Tax=Caerostris darwini TaxID=1538125 RepID=A0AAV4R359_9ARAC|nr:hypothetical protein CDAR_68901 [Caerostris darwini]